MSDSHYESDVEEIEDTSLEDDDDVHTDNEGSGGGGKVSFRAFSSD